MIKRAGIVWLAGLIMAGGWAWADVPENAGKPAGRLAIGEAAPEIVVTTVDGKGTSLGVIRKGNADGGIPATGAGPGKMVVLEFGSITDPIFRARVAAVERLAGKYGEKAAFAVVYQREAHPADGNDPLELNAEGFNIVEPTSIAERQKLAQQAIERLHLEKVTVVVDAWSNASSLRYGSYPNMTFVIDGKGILQAGYPFMDPAKVDKALEALAAGRELPAELRGSVKHGPGAGGWNGADVGGPAAFDFAGAAMDMTGGRGPASIAAVLDRMQLSDGQRSIILPAIADFIADLQEFRQTAAAGPRGGGAGRAGAPGAAGRAGAQGAPARMAATAPAAGPGGGAGGDKEQKVVTVQDVQAAQAELRASADRLRTAIRQNLNSKDAATLLQALDNMAPAQRLFGSAG